MVDGFSGEQVLSWPDIDRQTFISVRDEYLFYPAEFVVHSARRLQKEQPDMFDRLARHAVTVSDPHAGMKWSLLFYEAMARSAEGSGSTLPKVTKGQLDQLQYEDLNLLGAVDVDASLAAQALMERQKRQYQTVWDFAHSYGDGAADLAAAFMIHSSSETIEGKISDDFVWNLFKIMVRPSSS